MQENNSDRSFIVEKLVVSFNSLDYALPVLCYVARCILTEINNPRYEISIKINKPTNTINVFLHLYKLTSLEFYQFLFLYKTILANYRKKDLNVYMRLFQIQRNYIFPFAISQEMLRSYYDTCKAAKQFDVLQPNKSENLKTKLNVVHKSTEESFAILLDKKKDSYTISITTNMTQILEDYVHKSAKTFANAVTEKEMNLLKEANFLEVDGFVISHLKSINLGRASSLTGTEDYSSNCCLFNYFLLKKIYPGIKFDRDFLLLNLIFFRSLKDLHEPTSLARNLISSNWLGNQSFVYNFQNVIVDYKKKVLRERDRVVLQEKIQYLQALGVIIIEEQNEYQMILKFSQKTLMTLERGLILDEKLAFKIFEDIKFISSTKTSGDLLLAIFEEKMFHQDMYFPYDVISKDAKEKFSGFLEKCKKNEVILIPKELKTSLKKVKKKKEGF